jgi:hypothetical protein
MTAAATSSIRVAADSSGGYRSSMNNRGCAVALPVAREADVAQAQIFHSLLAARRAALCDHLDQQAERLARYERNRDSAGAQRNRLRIKEIGAEIRDIDRMIHALTARLLSVATPDRVG